jgi:BNR repeat protein
MSRHAAIAFALFLIAIGQGLEKQAIVHSVPLTIAVGRDGGSVIEPHLALSPASDHHWLAAAIRTVAGETFEARLTRQVCESFLSFDEGATWTPHTFAVTSCFDPWVVFTPRGTAIVSMLGVRGGGAPQDMHLFVFRSADGGRTWDSKPVDLGGSHDHPTMAVDFSDAHRGVVYLTSHRPTRGEGDTHRWGPFVARSEDDGKTFSDGQSIVPNNLHNLAEMSATLSDGTLIVPFVDSSHLTDKELEVKFDRRRAWIIRSQDGGRTFSVPLFVNDACGSPFRLSALVVDPSPAMPRDRLYFACRRAGRGPIVVNTSVDQGSRWNDPVAVTSIAEDSEERIPGLAVNHNGMLLVAWMDGGVAPGHNCEQSLQIVTSRDHGQTFSPPDELSRIPRCADDIAIPFTTGGDYFGLVAMPDGHFRIIWSESPGGQSRLRTSVITVH